MSILDQPLVFVDIETNGLDYVRGHVIEVAAIRLEAGQITKKFISLVDPGSELPQFITGITGIGASELRGAPTFAQIADELHEVLSGAIFVAHNVRFDYSFLKQEFKRLGQPFLPKQLCTVKLSRALYPHERKHKLENLINRYELKYSNRHRAYDDAHVLYQFVQHLLENFPPEQIEAAIKRQIRQPALPKELQPEIVRDLPESPGVYIFEDSSGRPLYVGKSVNIKKRVLSHFARDHAETKEFKIAQTISHIRAEQTTGELTALLLEARLVKELQPLYNRKLRRLSKLILVKQSFDDRGYISVNLQEANFVDPDDTDSILAIYPRRGRAKEALEEMSRTFDLCPKLMGLEKAAGGCFLYQLHKCRGACLAKETAETYNQRLMTAFENQRIDAWPFKGPILLQEKTGDQNVHGIIVDKWCVVGEVTQEPFCEPVVRTADKYFDLDTYKILRSHIAYKLNSLSIRPLNPAMLDQLSYA